MKKVLLGILGVLLLSLSVFGCNNNTTTASKTAEQSPSQPKRDVVAGQGVVAAAHPLAAQAGLEVLKKGGNAFDAAVATAFSLGVVEPHASGMGGGGFAILYVAKEQKCYVIDFREVAPTKGRADFFKRDEKGKVTDNALMTGWFSAGVPGEVSGMDLINKKFGSMQWSELLQPAIKQAEDGLVISETLGKITADEFDRMQKFPSKDFFEQTFLKDGLPVEAGSKVINKDYATSLKKVAEGGADVFYKGEIADAIAKAYEQGGDSWITKEDLANYHAEIRTPLESTYRGYTIAVVPPPSSGGLTVSQMLNILEGYDLSRYGAGSPEYIHRFIEAQRLAFADRAKYIGDPSFVDIPARGLLSKQYADTLRQSIDPQKAGVEKVDPGNPNPFEAGSTTSFSVVDKEGNMISVTKSINHFYGGGVVPAGTGIMMNDHMDDFDSMQGKINSPAPGKKPLSSMSPVVILKDGHPFMTMGSPGGPRIISAVVNVLVNVIDFGMDMQPAIEAARFHNPNATATDIEGDVSADVLESLKQMGHNFNVKNSMDLFFGGVQGIMYGADGQLHGGADPRRDGVAVGY